jgi:Na+/H+ antiporter NhaD/arsenite permease-like protein
MDERALALLIFALAYVAIVTEIVPKTAAALLGGLAMVALRVVDQEHAFEAIDLNVIFLLAGMMVIAHELGRTGVFQWLAVRTAKVARGDPTLVLVLLCLITAVGSAFLDNVTTVVLMVPLTLFLARILSVEPVPFLIAEVMASNIGGVSTLVGDPPNVVIGSAADIDFLEFIVHAMPVAVLVLGLFLLAVYLLFRPRLKVSNPVRESVMEIDERELVTDARLLRVAGPVALATIVAFLFHGALGLEPATIALAGAALLIVLGRVSIEEALREVEWNTLFFFVGLFMMVQGLAEVGLLSDLGQALSDVSGDSVGLATMLVLWPAVLLSSVLNQIPYTTVMVPVVGEMSRALAVGEGAQNPLWWALAFGVGFGANLTTVGAAANVYVVNVAARAGYDVSFLTFLRYGSLVTLVSAVVASAYLWIRYLAF